MAEASCLSFTWRMRQVASAFTYLQASVRWLRVLWSNHDLESLNLCRSFKILNQMIATMKKLLCWARQLLFTKSHSEGLTRLRGGLIYQLLRQKRTCKCSLKRCVRQLVWLTMTVFSRTNLFWAWWLALWWCGSVLPTCLLESLN